MIMNHGKTQNLDDNFTITISRMLVSLKYCPLSTLNGKTWVWHPKMKFITNGDKLNRGALMTGTWFFSLGHCMDSVVSSAVGDGTSRSVRRNISDINILSTLHLTKMNFWGKHGHYQEVTNSTNRVMNDCAQVSYKGHKQPLEAGFFYSLSYWSVCIELYLTFLKKS